MVGPASAQKLARLGIKTVADLLYHLPFRYQDYRLFTPLSRVQPGETVTIQGEITSFKNEYTKTGKKIQKALVTDQTGSIEALWFNQPFLASVLRIGRLVNLAGKADWWGSQVKLISPEYEIIKPKTKDQRLMTIHTGRLIPIYPETAGVSSKWLRSRLAPLIQNFLPTLQDWLPESLKKEYELPDLATALSQIHFPQNKNQSQKAKERLAFEEMLLIHLASLSRKKNWQQKSLPHPLALDQKKINHFLQNLPFQLTNAQKRVIKEILADLAAQKPMNRLLQGDVGVGKTVVAAVAMYATFLNNLQSALMAPTEILANQHYRTIKTLLQPYGVKIALLTGSQKKAKDSAFDILIGTHALIHQSAQFKALAFVVVDEQHRFGVKQRAKLIKKGQSPHLLTMTATPIPRTIALTFYGDLDLSLIDETPPGKAEIKTWVVPPKKREAGYRWIKNQIKSQDVQAFVICPLIEESVQEKMKDIKAATAEYERLKKIFSDLKLGLLHGRLKAKEKDRIMTDFRRGALNLLVSTPVVEVGIDIPQATIIIIEGADRFGLAQLHQLRGRVGRRNLPSYCFLFTESSSLEVLKRLKVLEKTNIGLQLAEYDLKLRGPGELLGTRQHGFLNLKAGSWTNLALIKKTRKAARQIFPQIPRFPSLQKKLSECKIDTIITN